MGSLGAPLVLCPLPDREGLLGIQEDQNPTTFIIVTLSKNIAIKYNVKELKQEGSWASSRHWFTSAVVWAKEESKYAAIMDNHTIALWAAEDTTLQNVDKFKFSEGIKFLLPSEKETIVVFANGFSSPLKNLLHIKRKDVAKGKGVLNPHEEEIIEATFSPSTAEVLLLSKNKKGEGTLLYARVLLFKKDDGCVEVTFKAQVDSSSYGGIIGQAVLVSSPFLQGHQLIFVDGGGRVLTKELSGVTNSVEPVVRGSLNKRVSLKCPIALRPHPFSPLITIYASHPSEEGAVVLLYTIKYDVVVSSEALKLWSPPPVVYLCGGHLLLPMGLHLLTIPVRTERPLLSHLVGKHAMEDMEIMEHREPFTAEGLNEWDDTSSNKNKSYSHRSKASAALENERKLNAKEKNEAKKKYPNCWDLVMTASTLRKEGQPQSMICHYLFPSVLEKGREAMSWIMKTFPDIPESLIIKILARAIEDVQEKDNGYFSKDDFLNSILLRQTDTMELVTSLRESLTFPLTKKLVLYITSRLQSSMDPQTNSDDLEDGSGPWILSRWVLWLNCILDAIYVPLVHSSEKSVIESVIEIVKESISIIEAFTRLHPHLAILQEGNQHNKGRVEHKCLGGSRSVWRTQVLTFI